VNDGDQQRFKFHVAMNWIIESCLTFSHSVVDCATLI
jgi:hypothetical protein